MDGTDFELRLYRHLNEVASYLDQTRDATAALRFSLRAAREFFEAEDACLATLPPGSAQAELAFVLPYGGSWDSGLLTEFLRGERPIIPHDVILAKLRRRDRPWGAIGLRRTGVPYEKAAVRALAQVAGEISAAIQRIDRDRLLEVRARIDGKVVQQIPSKDLFYQILDGLRSLTGYDHSSAVLIHETEPDLLRVAAEKIAWFKGKSRRIGRALPLSEPEMKLLRTEAVYGFDRIDGEWRDWPGQSAEPLARLLGYHDGDPAGDGEGAGSGTGGAPPGPAAREATMLCAPLTTREGPIGLLKVSALHVGTFGPYEADLVQRFMSIATVAIQNSQKTETLQARMLEAVRKHAIVDLARGVSHDINNALGAVLPLVQQMQEDVRGGHVDPAVHEKDLQQIEQSLQICRRIFSGMLSFARGSARNAGEGDARRAVEGTLGVLSDTLERRGVRLDIEVPDGLPFVKGGQGDLEQLFLNLITNARDAMESGGVLTVRARPKNLSHGPGIEIVIEDTGIGIPPDRMAKIQEPFFTTKPHGTGLGLSTCRWIVWEMRGEMKIESEPGRGTRVTITLPVIDLPDTGGGSVAGTSATRGSVESDPR